MDTTQVQVTTQKTKFNNADVIQITKITPLKNVENLTRDQIVQRQKNAQDVADYYTGLLGQFDGTSVDPITSSIPVAR